MKHRAGIGYVVGIVLLISLAGTARAASEGDGQGNTYYGTGTSPGTAWYNTFFGSNSGHSTTNGGSNTFIGLSAGYSNTTGSYNIFVGEGAGYHNIGSYHNIFIGYSSGGSNTTGSNNTFVGYQTGIQNTEGYNNVYIGYGAGYMNTEGFGNVFIGMQAGANDSTGSNMLYIANTPTLTPLIKGDFSAGTVTIYGTLTTASDERLKKNIKPLDAALKQIMSLQGVSYEWKEEFIKGKPAGNKQIGLIAQEVEKVMPELVLTDTNGYKAIVYDKLAPVLIEAVKEQQTTIQDQKRELAQFNASLKEKDADIKRLEKALEKMERRMVALEGPAPTLALK
jgi:hypothetical protein